MVYDLDRRPLMDAVVTSSKESGLTALTDLHGRFGLGRIPYGPVMLSIKKPGYEPIDLSFQFQNSSQIVYLQIASIDQLLDRAATSLEKKDWKSFQDFMRRAKVLNPESLQGVILEATGMEQQGELDKAIALLEGFQTDQPVLAIELLLGDLCAKKGAKEKAIEHWMEALKIKEDSAIRVKIKNAMEQ
jgi:tetratricopeptide (TPR) repeat protein